jgi:Flp pilus assembly protein TadG
MRTVHKKHKPADKRILKGQWGAEVVEMAFILPVLLMLLLGIFYFARAYNVYETMTRAAREGARVAVAPNCAACSAGGQYPGIATIASTVNASLVASSLDPAKVACGTCGGTCYGSSPAICYQNGVVLNPSTTPSEYGVVVSFNYPFQLAIPFVTFNQNITLSTTVRMRQE